jgi:hypothetical protein
MADATGKRASSPAEAEKPAEAPATTAAEEKSDASPGTPPAAEGKGKFVFVELAISNKAGAAIKYKGWNNTSAMGAILADDQNQVFPLVPIAETPGVKRLTAADVPGGGTIVETLVFQAPTGSFDALHLALPQSVFYPSMKGKCFALEITPDVLSNEGGPPVALPPAEIAAGETSDALVNGRRTSTEPGVPESPAETIKPEPKKAAAKVEPPPPPKKPSLFDDVNKSVEAEEKVSGKKMDEGKGAEAPKKPEPAKKTPPPKGKK